MNSEALSVHEVATLCGVDHSTVGYWIRKKKLCADRSRGKYSIRLNDLLFYLKSSGRDIPQDLLNRKVSTPYFGTIQNCWDYWEDATHGNQCKSCVVYLNGLKVCFMASIASHLKCDTECSECAYYQHSYLSRISFVQQIDHPVAIYKDMHVWGVNSAFADLCGKKEKEFIGLGMEHLFHHDSLENCLSNIKRRSLGDPDVPDTYNAHLKSGEQGRRIVQISVYPLKEPSGTFMMMAEKE